LDDICDRCHGELWVTTPAWNARFGDGPAWQAAIERVDRRVKAMESHFESILDDEIERSGMYGGGPRTWEELTEGYLDEHDLIRGPMRTAALTS
jgi:hypothetical protein